ncbi:MAG: transposase [Kiritimatiellae bacterium]|nr:transposase [Kiritimatiellia bacterium]
MQSIPRRPPRMLPFQKYGQPIWFVTLGTYDRKPVLNNVNVARRFQEFGKQQKLRGIAFGRYVIMPDHIHFFIRIAIDCKLGTTIGFLKKVLSKTLKQQGVLMPHWQPGFFDHLIRDAESYMEKWDYVYCNPVRAGLVESADEWSYSGEVVSIQYG